MNIKSRLNKLEMLVQQDGPVRYFVTLKSGDTVIVRDEDVLSYFEDSEKCGTVQEIHADRPENENFAALLEALCR